MSRFSTMGLGQGGPTAFVPGPVRNVRLHRGWLWVATQARHVARLGRRGSPPLSSLTAWPGVLAPVGRGSLQIFTKQPRAQ
jgi:hypothetical protein